MDDRLFRFFQWNDMHIRNHSVPGRSAGYPADFAVFDVYADRVEVEMQRAPAELIIDPTLGDIHGAHRHGIDYIDDDHPDHESYVSGHAQERRFTIEPGWGKQPDRGAPHELTILHEASSGDWRAVHVPA